MWKIFQLLTNCWQLFDGYVLGIGNNMPEYVPDEKYFAMNFCGFAGVSEFQNSEPGIQNCEGSAVSVVCLALRSQQPLLQCM